MSLSISLVAQPTQLNFIPLLSSLFNVDKPGHGQSSSKKIKNWEYQGGVYYKCVKVLNEIFHNKTNANNDGGDNCPPILCLTVLSALQRPPYSVSAHTQADPGYV